MTIIDMESWMAYKRYGNDDTNTAGKADILRALNATNFQTVQQNPVTTGWVVNQHPLYPERNALIFSAPNQATSQYIVRKIVATGRSGTLIGGFSLYVPGTFVGDTDGSGAPYPFLMIFAGAANSPILNMEADPSLRPNELFRIRYDLQIGVGTEVQSSRRVVAGKLAYLEYRITPSEVRVWLDDALVFQRNVSINFETIGFGTVSWAPSSGKSPMYGADGKWAIADWYNLMEDDVLPNKRGGPSTRIIGTLPKSDAVAQFVRPAGYLSNAAVAALPLDPLSSVFLKTDTVGATDVYVGNDDSATAAAAIIHAVGVKAFAQNVEAVPHTIKPLVVSGNVEQGTSIPLQGTMSIVKSFSTIDPATGVAWTPAAAAVSKFGVKIDS